jgi:hypothetical protein
MGSPLALARAVVTALTHVPGSSIILAFLGSSVPSVERFLTFPGEINGLAENTRGLLRCVEAR